MTGAHLSSAATTTTERAQAATGQSKLLKDSLPVGTLGERRLTATARKRKVPPYTEESEIKGTKKENAERKKTTAAVSRSAASYRPPRTTKHAGLSQARATSSATSGTARTDGFAFLGSPPRREEAHSRGSHSRSRKMRKRWRVGSLSRWIEKRSCRRSSSGSVSYVPAVSRGVASGTASTRHADDAAKR